MIPNCMMRMCNLIQSDCEDFLRNKMTLPFALHFKGQSTHTLSGVTAETLIWGKC